MEDFISAGGIESLLEVLRVCQARQNDSKPARGRQEQTMLRKISVGLLPKPHIAV